MSNYIKIVGTSIFMSFIGEAGAANVFWDAGSPTGNGTVTSADGDWDFTTPNFTADNGATNIAFTDGDDVFFGDVGSTVTLTQVVSPTSLTFNVGGYTLLNPTAGGIATGADEVTMTVTNAGDRVFLNTVVSGAGEITFAGAGTSVILNGRLDSTVSVNNNGNLELGGVNETVNIYNSNGGTIGGTGTMTATTFNLNNAVTNVSITGAINTTGTTALNFGARGLLDVNGGTTTLSGGNSLSIIDILPGANLIAGVNALDNTGTVNNDGALDIQGHDQTVGTYNSNGTLNGTGTLTAGSYTLGTASTGATVNANLGEGSITANGTVQLNGTSEGDLTVASGTTSLVGQNGGDISINTGARIIAEADTFSAEAEVTNNGTTILNGDQTVTTYTSEGSTATTVNLAILDGTGTLNAETYNLNDLSEVYTNLGTGNVIVNGGVTIAGQVAGDVSVESGLTTFSGDLMGDLNIASGATYASLADTLSADTNVVNDGILNLQAGTTTISSYTSTGIIRVVPVPDTGILVADTYNLNDGSEIYIELGPGNIITNGTINLGLASAGTLEVQSGTTTLSGNNSGDSVTINTDATLNAGLGTIDSAADVVNGGTLNLVGDQTLGTYTSTGTINGPGILTAGTYNLNGGTQVNLELGLGNLITNGAVSLNQASAGDLTVQSGTTILNALNSSTNLTVNDGATLQAGGTTLNPVATMNNAGTFNMQGDTTLANYAGGSGALTGSGILTTNNFTAGSIATTLTGPSNLSLSVNTPNANLGSGSQLVLNGGSAGLTLLDEFDLFIGDGTVSGTGATAGFGSFDLTGLDQDVRAVFNVETGNLIVIGVTGSEDPITVSILESLMGLDAGNDDQLTNIGNISATSQQAINAIGTQLAANPGSTVGSLIDQISPDIYACLADYATYQHLGYTRSLESAYRVVGADNWELALGGNYQSISKDDADLTGSGAYLGIYNQISQTAKIGVFGAFDSGSISSSLADIDTKGSIIGLSAHVVMGEFGILNLGVSGGSFEYDGSRNAIGLTNNINGVKGSTLNLEAGYKPIYSHPGEDQLSPFITVNHIITDIDSFNETGSATSLSIADYSKSTTLISLGIEGDWHPTAERYGFSGRLAYTFNKSDEDNSINATLANGNDFSVDANGITGNVLELRIGAFYELTERANLDLSYFSLAADDVSSAHGANLGVRMFW